MGRHGTIAGRKQANDAKRGKLFTKYSRAIIVAAKQGGDPFYNMQLKHAIERAKSINMPNDNIQRAIKKGTGELDGETFEEGMFEGYGPSGVAVIVDVLTDNKNRTASNIKHAFDKFGGNLGVPGCVSYMFNRKGYILIEKTDEISEEELMEIALEAGAEDFITSDDDFEIITEPEDFIEVEKKLKEAGYELLASDIEYLPSIESEPDDKNIEDLTKMIEMLEEDDDVQKVYTNCKIFA